MAGRGERAGMAVRRGRAGRAGRGQRETGVDRTPPPPGPAPAGAPVGSTPAAERRKKSKRGGAARPERPRPHGEASTTGAAQRALALEPDSFRYAYRTGHAARCRDVARSRENRMKTTKSVPQTREDAALSPRTSRVDERFLQKAQISPGDSTTPTTKGITPPSDLPRPAAVRKLGTVASPCTTLGIQPVAPFTWKPPNPATLSLGTVWSRHPLFPVNRLAT